MGATVAATDAFVAACRARLDALAEMVELPAVAIRYGTVYPDDSARFYRVMAGYVPLVNGRRVDAVFVRRCHRWDREWYDGLWPGDAQAPVAEIRDHAIRFARKVGGPIWLQPGLPDPCIVTAGADVEVIRP
jgi:hypothetical protein